MDSRSKDFPPPPAEPTVANDIAWQRLHGYRDRLVRKLTNMLSRSEDVEDLVQECYRRLCSHPDKVVQYSTWSALSSIAAQVVADHLRRTLVRAKAIEPAVSDEQIHALPASRTEQPEVRASSAQILDALVQALGELEPTQKPVMHKCLLEGISLQQIADTLKITVNAVEQRHTRAMAKLQENPVLRELMGLEPR